MTLLIVVSALAAVIVWVLASAARIGIATAVVYVMHPHLTVWFTAVLAVLALTIAAMFLRRGLAESGWRLVTVSYRPVDGYPEARHG